VNLQSTFVSLKKSSKVLYKYPLSTKPMCLFMCHSLHLSVCVSVCLRITERIFLKFDTGKFHTEFSSHFSVSLDHIILLYNLHEDWLYISKANLECHSLCIPQSQKIFEQN